MPANGLIGNGSKAGSSATSPHVWLRLEQVEEITPPKLTADKIDTTRMGTSRYKTNMPGMFQVGDVVIKMLCDPDPATAPNQNLLYGYLANQDDRWWRTEFPSSTDLVSGNFHAYEFQGRVSDLTLLTPTTGKQELSVNVTFDGTSLVHYFPMASALG